MTTVANACHVWRGDERAVLFNHNKQKVGDLDYALNAVAKQLCMQRCATDVICACVDVHVRAMERRQGAKPRRVAAKREAALIEGWEPYPLRLAGRCGHHQRGKSIKASFGGEIPLTRCESHFQARRREILGRDEPGKGRTRRGDICELRLASITACCEVKLATGHAVYSFPHTSLACAHNRAASEGAG